LLVCLFLFGARRLRQKYFPLRFFLIWDIEVFRFPLPNEVTENGNSLSLSSSLLELN
jgi:hypothetical protein